MTPQQADRGRFAVQRVRGARHVQTLAAGRRDQPERPMDVALDQAVDLEQLVDRRVRSETNDHAAAPRVSTDLR
jgi:hypothetical protein